MLASLDEHQWHASTLAGSWRVRDVAAHLLQGDLQRLSGHRDAYSVPASAPLVTYDDVLHLINTTNHAAVSAMQRYSPRVLIELLQWSGAHVSAFVGTLDPFAPAPLAVAWAGETTSLNWLDIGREYTERWHHQQQIRDAVGSPPLLQPEWAEPLFALSVRALPLAYRDCNAPDRTTIDIRIENGGTWSLRRAQNTWHLFAGSDGAADCTIDVDADDAWRIFYHALSPAIALQRLRVSGNADLAKPFVHARSVMV